MSFLFARTALCAALMLARRLQAQGLVTPPYFFPPRPPVCGTALDAPQTIDLRFNAPPELKPFVAEPFYLVLGGLVVGERITPELRLALAAHLKARRRLEQELRETLAATRSLSREEREGAYRASAARQRAELTRLEDEAEQLRRRCMTALALEWHSGRHARLGSEKAANEADVFTVTAFYRPELTRLQRELLWEVAIEAAAPRSDVMSRPIVAPDRRAIFFLPAAVRIILPARLPEEVQRKLAAFETLKSALKQELRGVAIETDLQRYSVSHPRWETVARGQTERLLELEALADEIRQRLVDTPLLSPSPAPEFPPELADRFARFRRDHGKLRGEFQAALARLREKEQRFERLPMVTETIVDWSTAQGEPSTPRVDTYSFWPQSVGNPAITRQARRLLEEFHRTHRARFDALARDQQALEAELAQRYPTHDPKLTPTAMLAAFLQLAAQTEAWPRYADFHPAALVPGWSPEQRRLLLGMALESLDLPLPGGEFSPKN